MTPVDDEAQLVVSFLTCVQIKTSQLNTHTLTGPTYFSSTAFPQTVVTLVLLFNAFFLACLSSASASAMRSFIDTTGDDSGVLLQPQPL